MWCANCKADVAAEVSPDSGRVHCAVCSMELAQAHAIREKTRDAREILERWSTKSMQDPYGPLPRQPQQAQATPQQPVAQPAPQPVATAKQTVVPAANPSADQPPKPVRTERAASKQLRFDTPTRMSEVSDTQSSRNRTQRKPVRRHVDSSHDKRLHGPHYKGFEQPRTNWGIATGQWLAYIGVLALTVGTGIVVYGHFGGHSNYTPTGWLITTLGQMLLFLGVINLVSGGMEQSNEEVQHRIEVLGEHILRIEAVAGEALAGPRIPAERYAQGEIAEHQNASQYAPTE